MCRIQTKGRSRPLDVFKSVEPNPGLPKYAYTADNDLLYPYPSDPYTYNPYENAEPYASTNTLWVRYCSRLSKMYIHHILLYGLIVIENILEDN